MPYKVEHHHYHWLDPFEHQKPALYKVFDGTELVAVVRERDLELRVYGTEPDTELIVDCKEALPELRAFLATYLHGRSIKYADDLGRGPWRDNGTHEPRP